MFSFILYIIYPQNTPDEVLRIPNDEMLIIIRGEKVLRANKFDFTEHPYAKRLIQSSVMDYDPNNKNLSQTENKNRKNKAARRAKSQTPETDYLKLLESFSPQSNNKTK